MSHRKKQKKKLTGKGKIRFLVGYHEVVKDFKEMKVSEKIKNVRRIYLESYSETLREHNSTKSAIERLKREKIRPEEAGFPKQRMPQIRSIFGRRDLTVYIEPPFLKGGTFEREKKLGLQVAEDFIHGDYEKAFKKTKEGFDLTIVRNKKRDEILVKDIIGKYRKNPDQDLLVMYGVQHSGVARELRKAGLPAKLEMEPKTYVFSPGVEYKRYKRFGKKLSKEREEWLLAAEIPSAFLSTYLEEYSNLTTNQVTILTRKIVRRLTVNDVKNISQYLEESGGKKGLSHDKAARLMIDWLKKHGKLKQGEIP